MDFFFASVLTGLANKLECPSPTAQCHISSYGNSAPDPELPGLWWSAFTVCGVDGQFCFWLLLDFREGRKLDFLSTRKPIKPQAQLCDTSNLLAGRPSPEWCTDTWRPGLSSPAAQAALMNSQSWYFSAFGQPILPGLPQLLGSPVLFPLSFRMPCAS
jgi:hypothetical protein